MLDCDNPVRRREPFPGENIKFRIIAGTVGPSSREVKNVTATVTAAPVVHENDEGELEVYDFKRQDRQGNEISVQNMILSKTFPDPATFLRPGMTAADFQDRALTPHRIAMEWIQNLMSACRYHKEVAGRTVTPTPQAQAQNHNEFCQLPAEYTAPTGKIDVTGELAAGNANSIAKILNALVGREFVGRVVLRRDGLHEISQILDPSTQTGAIAGLTTMTNRAEERLKELREAEATDDDVLKELGVGD